MEMTPLSYQETFQLIQELNTCADELDGAVLRTQQQHASKRSALAGEHARQLSDFNADCEAEITFVKKRSQQLLSDAAAIQSEMHSLDDELSEADKYYVKTKKKKQEELSGRQDHCYASNGDYFATLEQIRKDYTKLSRKYSDDILPGLVNGLNYLFSSQRKRDYEELILLQNTVDGFVAEILEVIPDVTAETVEQMRTDHEQRRSELVLSQKRAVSELEDHYNRALNAIAVNIDSRLNAIIPDELISYIGGLTNAYKSAYGKVNAGAFVVNNILSVGFIDYPVAAFIQSQTLASFINGKCKELMAGGSIKFPLICSTGSPLPLYIKKDGTNSAAVLQLMQGTIFSFLTTVSVSRLRLSVIDCENHGNSVEPFFDARKKLPDLFDEKFYTNYDDATAKIRSLNEKVEYISQNLLGSQYANIYGYAGENPESDCTVELLSIFDFPKGLDEQVLSALKNIITCGPRCGIYVIISQSSEITPDTYSKEFIDSIARIQKQCVVVNQSGDTFSILGLRYFNYSMPSRNDFSTFFSKYMLINEGIRNRGIAFPALLRELVDSKNDDELDRGIRNIRELVDTYNEGHGRVPGPDAAYPDQIMIGSTQYPADIFTDAFGFVKIKEAFSLPNGRIALPLALDMRQTSNIIMPYYESKDSGVVALSQHIIWRFLSTMPVVKTNICIFDADKKGGSAIPFLDFKKKCPDVFDENIYTTAEDIYERLNKLNRHIDGLIQDKLGNKFANLLEYNRNAPNRAEALTVLAIYDFPSGFDSRSLDLLQNVLKNGGRCGVYTLICYNQEVNYSAYESIADRIDAFKRYCSIIEHKNKDFVLLPFNLSITIKEPLPSVTIEKFISDYDRLANKIKNKGLSFDDILDRDLFSRDLSKGLSIPVGVGDGESIVPVVFGVGSSHHALVAGATGSGKSTLLHTLIMSAMLHYTPDLLHLYLMDFKSGTEFKVYETKRLPHIKLLALDAMQEFGESILENLVAEMTARSEKFKAVGASNLGEYVKAAGKPMPKILVIMDEFQILFNDSANRKVAYNCAELTKRIVTEGRSFGIHLLMSTQSTKIITDLTISTGTIEQMRIRVGLKCGEYDAHYLFTERNETEALEMMKGPIGTVVLNQEYTEGDNIGFRAAYCDDAAQEKYLDMIAERFAIYPYDLQSFEGGRTTPLLDVMDRDAGIADAVPLNVVIGSLIKVAPPLRITFDRRRKHNTLICGSSERMAGNIANLYSLAILQNARSKLYCFDGERLLGPSPEDQVYGEYSRFGLRFTIAESRGDIIRSINDIYDLYIERRKKKADDQIFILIKNLQFLDIVKTMLKGEPIDENDYLEEAPAAEPQDDGIFDFGADFGATELNISDKLLKLVDDGSAYGIHFIVTSLEYQTVKESMYFGENVLSKFPERYVFALNDNDSESLIENVSVTSLRDNTVYYSDSVKNTFQVKPYVFPGTVELAQYIDSLLKGGDGQCRT